MFSTLNFLVCLLTQNHKMRILKIFFFIILDISIYLFLGLVLLNYEDHFDRRKGDYYSFKSMNSSELLAYIGFGLWQIINLGLILYILFKLFKRFKTKD